MTNLYTMRDVTRILGIPPYKVNYAYSAGLIEEPKLRLAGKRVFQPSDLQRLASHFNVEIKALVEEDACTTNTST